MSGLLTRPVHNLKALYYGSPIYRLALLGRAPDQVLQAPTDPWPGDAENGRAMAEGRWRLAGQTLTFDPRDGTPRMVSRCCLDRLAGGTPRLCLAAGSA